jgi:hypothetical protein
MTRLSGAWLGAQWVPGDIALARRSLLMLAMSASSAGCVDATPTYTAPVQSPPIILGNQVTPPTHKVQTVILKSPPPTTVSLRVPFRSIDAGEGLVAIFWVDWDPTQPLNRQRPIARGVRADSSPLDEQNREVTFDWEASTNPPGPGCRTVTMVLSHASNYPIDPENGIFVPGLLPPIDVNDIAQVTWFFDVQDPSDPSPSPVCWGNSP